MAITLGTRKHRMLQDLDTFIAALSEANRKLAAAITRETRQE